MADAPRTSSQPVRHRFLLAFGAVLVTLALSEAVLRLRPVKLQHTWLLTTHIAVLNPDLIYAKPAHLDPAYYRRAENLPNVITIGDSFTASFPVRKPRKYPLQLARILAQNDAPMNVIDLGLGDSGPDQHLRLFEEYALKYVRPDIVIWQLYTNDLWDNVEKQVLTIKSGRLEPQSALHNWLYWRQLMYDLTPLPMSVKYNSALYRNLLKATEAGMRAQLPAEYARNPDGWALAKLRLELDEMERLGREHNFRTYFVVVPPQATYIDGRYGGGNDLEHVRKRDAMLRERVAQRPGFIDFRLQQRGAEPVAEYFYSSDKRDHNRLGDRHLNRAGYRAMAEQIAARVLADWRSRADAVASARPAVP